MHVCVKEILHTEIAALAVTVDVGRSVSKIERIALIEEGRGSAARLLVDAVTEVLPVLVQTRPLQHVAAKAGETGRVRMPPTLMSKPAGILHGTLTGTQVAWRASREAPRTMLLEAAASARVTRVAKRIC